MTPTSRSNIPAVNYSARTRRRIAPLLVTASLATVGMACRSDPPVYEPDLSPIKSGDRLRARWVSNASGDVRYFEGWYDTELGVNCDWTKVEEEYRCLPPRADFVYRDSGCTEPAVLNSSCDPLEYASPPQGWIEDCADPFVPQPLRVHTVGGVIDAAAPSYWQKQGSNCVEIVPDAPVELSAVGTEVPLSTFASAEIRRDYSGTRLAVDFLRSDDGSQEQFVTWDLELNSPCTPDYVRAEGLCLPPSNVYLIQGDAGYFGSADCSTERLAFASACEPEGFVYEFVQDGSCGYTSRYFELGERWDQPVYTGEQGTCVEVTQSVYSFHTIGAQLSESQFVQLDSRTYGGGRLQMSVPSYEGEIDVTVPRSPPLFDTTLGIECSAAVTSDGGLRCLPSQNTVNSGPLTESALWGDSTCSDTPLYIWDSPSTCNPVFDWYVTTQFDACGRGSTSEIYERGAAWTGELYAKIGAECTPTTISDTATAYRMEGPVPFNQFAALERVVD